VAAIPQVAPVQIIQDSPVHLLDQLSKRKVVPLAQRRGLNLIEIWRDVVKIGGAKNTRAASGVSTGCRSPLKPN
jgi:hypothetical protein